MGGRSVERARSNVIIAAARSDTIWPDVDNSGQTTITSIGVHLLWVTDLKLLPKCPLRLLGFQLLLENLLAVLAAQVLGQGVLALFVHIGS